MHIRKYIKVCAIKTLSKLSSIEFGRFKLSFGNFKPNVCVQFFYIALFISAAC